MRWGDIHCTLKRDVSSSRLAVLGCKQGLIGSLG